MVQAVVDVVKTFGIACCPSKLLTSSATSTAEGADLQGKRDREVSRRGAVALSTDCGVQIAEYRLRSTEDIGVLGEPTAGSDLISILSRLRVSATLRETFVLIQLRNRQARSRQKM